MATNATMMASIAMPCASSLYFLSKRHSSAQDTNAARMLARAWLASVKYTAIAQRASRLRRVDVSWGTRLAHSRSGAPTTPITAPSEFGLPITLMPRK